MSDNNTGPIRIFDAANKATVFIVDYGEYMHEQNGYRFQMAIKELRLILNDLCCTGNDRELVSVLFINTEKTNASADNVDGLFVDRELMPVNVEYIKKLDAYLEDRDGARAKFHKKLGTPGVCNWMEVFYHCKKAFQSSYKNRIIAKKFVRIFSSQFVESVPQDILSQAITHADDLKRSKTTINVFLLCDPDEQYDDAMFPEEQVNPFWLNFDEHTTFVREVEGLFSDIKRKTYTLRANSSVPFRLADGVEMAIAIYNLIKPKTKPQTILLHAETNRKVECKTHLVQKKESVGSTIVGGGEPNGEFETAERDGAHPTIPTHEKDGTQNQVEPLQFIPFSQGIKYAVDLGGERLVISHAEKQTLIRLDKPGITVIGFKPLSLLKLSHRMGESTYMFPLEAAIKGSATLYRALLDRCLERKLFILARYCMKMNTTPKLIAIIPQAPSAKANDPLESYYFEGFHILRLPYAEDSRSLEEKFSPPKEKEWPNAKPEQVGAARKFIRRIKGEEFHPDAFMNPENQRIYRAVETVALGQSIEEFEKQVEELDQLRPYYEIPKYEKRARDQLEQFVNICGLTGAKKEKEDKRDEEENDSETVGKGKRGRKPTATEGKGRGRKKKVVEEDD